MCEDHCECVEISEEEKKEIAKKEMEQWEKDHKCTKCKKVGLLCDQKKGDFVFCRDCHSDFAVNEWWNSTFLSYGGYRYRVWRSNQFIDYVYQYEISTEKRPDKIIARGDSGCGLKGAERCARNKCAKLTAKKNAKMNA